MKRIALPVLTARAAGAARAAEEVQAACDWLGAHPAQLAEASRRAAREAGWDGAGAAASAGIVAALARGGEEAAAALRRAAQLGEACQTRGAAAETLMTGHFLLAEAARRVLAACPSPPSPAVLEALQGAVSLAAAAALLGHARPALEAEGRWPAALDELLEAVG
ncbi:MAG TPA: hypothetical protein VF142_05755 [Longimicrobium sp.]